MRGERLVATVSNQDIREEPAFSMASRLPALSHSSLIPVSSPSFCSNRTPEVDIHIFDFESDFCDQIKRNLISYSIWLMPEGGIKDALQNKIMTCCSDFGGSIFEPHVTLIGSFLGDEKKLIGKTRRISKKYNPLKYYLMVWTILMNFSDLCF